MRSMASSICFKLDIHWLTVRVRWGKEKKKKNKTLVWVVGVSQRDHVLDPEEQSNRDKGGC